MTATQGTHRSTNAFSITKWPGSLLAAFGKAARLEHLPQFFQHRRAAAHHDAVGFDIERRLADIVEQLFRGDQVGDAAAVAERLAGDGRIIQQLLGQQRPEQFVVAQLRHQLFAIGEFGDLPAAVHQHDGFKPLVHVGVLDQARERRQPRAGRQQQQALARNQIVGDQRAGRLAPDQDGVAFPDLLKPRGQRPVGDLDGEEFQLFLVIGARHAVGAHQRTAIDLEADHGELPVQESKAGIAGGGEAEKRVGPVPDRKNFLSIERAHVFWFFRLTCDRTNELFGPERG